MIYLEVKSRDNDSLCHQEHDVTHSLIVHYGGSVSDHGLLLDDVDELKGAAHGSIRVGPFRALEMSHLQDIVILLVGEILDRQTDN